jgi:8-oxo-dGTP pyrophosphatase MutT (NUDIX family)
MSSSNVVITKWHKSACVVVYDSKTNKYLTVSRKDNPNDPSFCGGKLDEGESFKDAAIREMGEETGLWLPFMEDEICSVFSDFHIDEVKKDTLYYCEVFYLSYEEQNVMWRMDLINSQVEKGVVKWLSREEIEEQAISFKSFIKQIFKRICD